MRINPIASSPEWGALPKSLQSSALGKLKAVYKVEYSIKKKVADTTLLAKLDKDGAPLVIGPSGLFTSNGWGYRGKFYLDKDNEGKRKGKSFRFTITPDHGPFRGTEMGLLPYVPSTALIFSEADPNLPSFASELTSSLEQDTHAHIAVSHRSAAILVRASGTIDKPISSQNLSRRRALWAMLSTFVVQAVLLILLVECASIKDFSLLTLIVQGALWLVSVYFFLLACSGMGGLLTTQRSKR